MATAMHAINSGNISNNIYHQLMNIESVIESNVHHFLLGMRAEYRGDKEAFVIIRKYLSDGKISDEDDKILKTQVMDSLKIIGIRIPLR